MGLSVCWPGKSDLQGLAEDGVLQDELAFLEAGGGGLDIGVHEAVTTFGVKGGEKPDRWGGARTDHF